LQEEIQNAMRRIPPMGRLLSMPRLGAYSAEIGQEAVKSIISDVLAEQRAKITKDPDTAFDDESIVREAEARLRSKAFPSLRRLVNATGVVIHTNLGRSLLAKEAVTAVLEIAGNYSNLEYSIKLGQRGQRNDHIEWLLTRLTGAEAAIVVNNNASAVILALSALAKDREAVVSRGELVEIGGSFRIPDIMALSGTKMVEVGTTNRTHRKDYESAITDETAMLLKVHPSNYRMTGFVSSVARRELADLAHERGIVFMEDLGSGMLVDTSRVGLINDPTVRECVEAGVDIVTFSGDKLLGGPQIGAVAGRADIISKLRTFPLLRALRVDKMTLAAFEATLRLYLKGEYDSIPTLEMVFKKTDELKKKARSLRRLLADLFDKAGFASASAEVCKAADAVGGGTFPESELEGYAVAVSLPELGSSGRLAEKLRMASVPVVTGASGDKLLFHVRTLRPGDDRLIVRAFAEILGVSEDVGQ